MTQFRLIKKLESGVRVGELETPHGIIPTPFFMPVGTVGSVKGMLPNELKSVGANIILSNTYHLYLRPGEQMIKSLGGLHDFMRWNGPILTDSGGYQVFSLGSGHNSRGKNKINGDKSLVKITEDGVEFKSHLDGSKHFFTPEKVIQIQLDLGVDILMPLDVCPSGKASYNEIKHATELTIRWAERAKRYFESRIKNQESRIMHESQNGKPMINDSKFTIRPMLHGIVQGGMDEGLRRDCAKKLIEMDFDGYSVGGLAVDLETRNMWQTVKLMGEILPENKQRYLMGVGTPDDIIQAARLGMDMFDCVLPTRLARHGSVYVQKRTKNNWTKDEERYALVNLLNSGFREDPDVIDSDCSCPVCRAPMESNSRGEIGRSSDRAEADNGGFSRAYIAHLLRSNEISGIRLTTIHNLYVYLSLVKELRQT
ncbi:MAG: tRNA guanosine(34) transglycosylase Tgt [Patescibacteria group bacterium]|jgi:queuine tRNA-ribosyltransferase